MVSIYLLMPEDPSNKDPSAFGFDRVPDADRAAALTSALAKLQSAEKPMNTPETPKSSDSAFEIRRLTFAVWALTVVIALHMGAFLLTFLFNPSPPMGFSGPTIFNSETIPPEVRRAMTSTSASFSSESFENPEKFNGFHSWPLQKKLEEASVVLVTRYQKDGDRYKAVVSEILKKKPGAVFYYKVGDEYQHGGYYPKEGTRYGDGQIMFFTGSPATMRYACSFFGDRISAFGDMPFEELRKILKKE